MARVLFLTQVLPYPLDSGAKIRAYYVLRHLARSHTVTLLSFVRDDDRAEYVAHLADICHAVHTVPMRRSPWRTLRASLRALASGESAIILRDALPEMQRTLRSLLTDQPFDVVHADQASMAQYAFLARRILARQGRASMAVLDAHNALYLIPQRLAATERNPFKRLALRRETAALARYEARVYPAFDRVVFVSEQDRAALQSVITRHGAASIHEPSPTIPICVDPADRALVERVPQPNTILHLGTMFWPPNAAGVLWFAREVFPRVLEQVPEARFVVVGKNPPQPVQALSQLVPQVEVTGYVADPLPYQQQAAAFIVPLHAGGGMRVKIVDAWGWGLPIVSTTLGAEGIEVRDGENILLADRPDAFAEAVIRLLREPTLGEHLRANGRVWLEARYNWRTIYSAWDAVYCP